MIIMCFDTLIQPQAILIYRAHIILLNYQYTSIKCLNCHAYKTYHICHGIHPLRVANNVFETNRLIRLSFASYQKVTLHQEPIQPQSKKDHATPDCPPIHSVTIMLPLVDNR